MSTRRLEDAVREHYEGESLAPDRVARLLQAAEEVPAGSRAAPRSARPRLLWAGAAAALLLIGFGWVLAGLGERHAQIRPMAQKVALARFSRTFATLVRSGVPIMGTLDIVADTAGNRVVAAAVRNSRESVRNGKMLSEPLSHSKVFPPMVVRMIAIGERTDG